MSEKEQEQEVQPAHGDKMIEVRIRFWTNAIAEEPGMVIPKNAWDSGVVIVSSSKAHNISSESPMPFHSLADLTSVVAKALVKHKIKLLPSNKKLYRR